MKNSSVTFLLWCAGFIGLCGLHRFYVGRTATGIIWLLTFGLLGFGQIFDLFFIGSMTREASIINGVYGGLRAMAESRNINTVAPVINVNVSVPDQRAPHYPSSLASADRPARLPQVVGGLRRNPGKERLFGG